MSDASAPPRSRAGALPLVGGVLALDFCNTASGRGTPGHLDHLREPEHLLAWCRRAGIIDADQEVALGQRSASGDAGQRLLARALALRDAIYRLDSALAAGHDPDQADMDRIAREHAACLAAGRLTSRDGAFGWTWQVAQAPDETVLGPIAASAMQVLTQADRARLKQCQGHHCGWLFLDTTKSNNRRWCEMDVCGNRAKQKRRRRRDVES